MRLKDGPRLRRYGTFVKRAKLEDQFKRIDLDSSEVHFLYLTAVFSLVGAGYLFWKRYPVLGIKPFSLLALSSIVAVAALLNDLRIERMETKLLSTIPPQEVDEMAARLGHHRCDPLGKQDEA